MVFSSFAVSVLANNTRVVPYFESCKNNTASKFGILDDFCVIKRFLSDPFDLFIIINPVLKSENPASCLCTIALFRCVRPAPLSTLREVRVLENA